MLFCFPAASLIAVKPNIVDFDYDSKTQTPGLLDLIGQSTWVLQLTARHLAVRFNQYFSRFGFCQ